MNINLHILQYHIFHFLIEACVHKQSEFYGLGSNFMEIWSTFRAFFENFMEAIEKAELEDFGFYILVSNELTTLEIFYSELFGTVLDMIVELIKVHRLENFHSGSEEKVLAVKNYFERNRVSHKSILEQRKFCADKFAKFLMKILDFNFLSDLNSNDFLFQKSELGYLGRKTMKLSRKFTKRRKSGLFSAKSDRTVVSKMRSEFARLREGNLLKKITDPFSKDLSQILFVSVNENFKKNHQKIFEKFIFNVSLYIESNSDLNEKTINDFVSITYKLIDVFALVDKVL